MTGTVELPLWLVALVLVLAAIAALDRILVPSARWVLRRRMERLVERVNTRLVRPIHPFRLLGRADMIVRLTHDPRVMEAVVDHARETGVPESVAFEQARAYAREIVPAFSALVYFGFATGMARRISRALYHVRVGPVERALDGIDPSATIVFVMNHRSNMDYVLVTWLVAGRSALSYAVGEWARVWPLSWLFRAMGAYFIRRGYRGTLYRRVLARYVQIITAEGITQAVFPEGGLSLDGRTGAPKMGILSYIAAGMEQGGRDVVFVPVGIGYDRVLEDRVLVEAAAAGERRFRAGPAAALGFVARMLWRIVRQRFPGFGAAAVAFGEPLSLRAFRADHRGAVDAEGLGAAIMARVAASVPVTPVPLVAAALAAAPMPRAALEAAVAATADRLARRGAIPKLPAGGLAAAAAQGRTALERRGIVAESGGLLGPAPGRGALFAFYAAPVLQMLDGAGSATAPAPVAAEGPPSARTA